MVDYTNDEAFAAARQFITRLGTLTHNYGVSSYRLQSYLGRVTRAIGLDGAFAATSQYIQFAFWREGETEQHVHFVPMSPPGLDMGRLSQVGGLVEGMDAGNLSFSKAIDALEHIDGQPPTFGPYVVALGYALAAAGFAVLLSAAWGDVLLATILGVVVYGIVLLAGRSHWIAYSIELSAAMVAALLANIAAIAMPGSDPFIVTMCAIIVLVPGLPLTLGLAELSSKHVIAGMQRLTDGVMSTLKLFLGAAIGTGIVTSPKTVPDATVPSAIAPLWIWLFAALLVTGLVIVLQVRPRDYPWVLAGGVLAYAGTVFGGALGFWQGAFISSVFLGLFASYFSWHKQLPTSIVMLTAILVLVPGASAFRGLHAFETSGLMSGLSAEWHVLVNMTAIVAGVLLAYMIVPDKARL